jgi:hypothetical protein
MMKRSRPAGGNLDDGTARPGGREQDTHPAIALIPNRSCCSFLIVSLSSQSAAPDIALCCRRAALAAKLKKGPLQAAL